MQRNIIAATISNLLQNIQFKNWPYIVLFMIIIYLLFWRNRAENFSNYNTNNTDSKDIRKFVPCSKCIQSDNHVDTRSKCDNSCKFSLPDNDAQSIGTFKGTKGVQCECGYKGKKKREYINCPTPYSLKDVTNRDCFIWNISEAEKVCPEMCKKYIPENNEYIKWTGNFDNTTAHTSACECEYYG